MKVFTNPITNVNVVNAVDNPKIVSNVSGLLTIDKDAVQISSLLTNEKLNYTNNLTFNSKLIPNTVMNSSAALHNVSIEGNNNKRKNFVFENSFDLTSSALASINKYQVYYSYSAAAQVMSYTAYYDTSTYQYTYFAILGQSAVSPSLFNEFYSVPLNTGTQSKNGKNALLNDAELMPEVTVNNYSSNSVTDGESQMKLKYTTLKPDITDCRTSRLCYLSDSNDPLLGHAKYKMADFLYCTDLGKVSNNYLITLRKFAVPIGDNIKEDIYLGNTQQVTLLDDIGRMVCWFGEENKLEDILKYSFQASWKEYNSQFDLKKSEEDKPTLLNSIMNLGAPSNLKLFAQGFDVMNENKFLGGPNSFIKLNTPGPYNYELLTQYDKNKVYEPKDTIRQTHQYEGNLTFNQDINLTFNYTLRAYGDINPKAALLDLLGNIQAVTYRRGKFWMGQNMVYGTQTNKRGWEVANKLIDNSIDASFGVLGEIMNGGGIAAALDSVMGYLSNVVTGLGNEMAKLSDDAKKALETKGKIYEGAKEAVSGMVKNYLGRPAKYAFNSLLSGAPTGLWHLTLGNPLNPIMSIGNLILTDTTVEHYGPLGIDDFPTGLKVKVTLKHSMPRDTIAIEQMYTEGSRTLTMPTAANLDIKNFQTVLGARAAKIPSPFGNVDQTQNMINMSALS